MHLLNGLILMGLVAGKMVQADIPCTDDPVARRVRGEMACYNSNGNVLSCDECLGRNGNAPATRSGGDMCVVITDSDGNFDWIACPGDPAPGPEGPESPWNGIVEAVCDAKGSGGLLGFPSTLACMMYVFVGGGDEYEKNLAGIMGKLS